MENIAVLVSGGVDSSVVVHLLCERGYHPSLFYIRIGDKGMECSMEEDIEICRMVARRYGLPLEVIDLHQEYWENVVTYLIDKIRRGMTPNPDVMCNRLIKFGCFEQKVGHFFDRTATGHYASVVRQNGKRWLGTAIDPIKDQTDFLAQIDYLQLSKLMFPLGEWMKEDVRRMARQIGLPNALRRDSQGICFLERIDYNQFIRCYLGEKEGAIIEKESGRRIGTHRGYWFHTIGQRKGLGLGGGPWFVIDKDIQENILYVSRGCDTSLQYGQEVRLHDFHFITENPWADAPMPVKVSFKIRHSPDFQTGRLTLERNGDCRLTSDTKLQGIASGQFGVIYDHAHRLCIGSGEIRQATREKPICMQSSQHV